MKSDVKLLYYCSTTAWTDLGGGGEGWGEGVATPPPPIGQKHSIEYSTTEVPSHAGALVYIAWR